MYRGLATPLFVLHCVVKAFCFVCLRGLSSLFLRLNLGLLEVCVGSREPFHGVLVGVLLSMGVRGGLGGRLAVVIEGVFVAS